MRQAETTTLENPVRKARSRPPPGRLAAVAVLALATAGCAMVPTIRENTRAIVRSAEGIAANTQRVGESSATLASLEPSMTKLAQLQGPMERLYDPLVQVAGLSPELRSAAELATPLEAMTRKVTELDESMAELEELRLAMDRLLALEASMDGLARLEGPMEEVAALRGPMQETSRLAQPMGELKASMDALMALARGPWVVIFLGAALVWSLFTFLAVWLGVVVGMRRAGGGRPAPDGA